MTVLLVDGLNLVHRGNITFGKQDPNKISYHIVYNCLRSLKAVIEQMKPEKVFFVWEGSANFRFALFPNYKANRIIKQASEPSKKNDIFRQADIIANLLTHLPITQVRAEKYEADDVIATLANNLKDEECIILSTDSDYLQLLQREELPLLRIYNPTIKGYLPKPEFHYLVWKSLRGDKSDNISGLISDNKALKMVGDAEALKNFLSIPENQASFNLNRSLIELKEVPDEELLLTIGTLNFSYLEKEFEKMEFKTMLLPKYWDKFKDIFSLL